MPTNVDWRDNFCAPLAGSVQYAAATAFADRYRDGSLLLTGHSKGGNVALYAQSAAQNPLARAAVFNAQGFACHALTRAQKQRLRAGTVNYVVAGDIVGALLCHPETRFYARQNPGANAHSPDAYAFDANGFPIAAKRTWLSRAVEFLSRLLLALESLGVTNITRRLLACPRPGITQIAWTAPRGRGIMVCVPGPPGLHPEKKVGNTMVKIDSHVHIYPDKIAAKAAKGIGKFYDITIHHDGSLTQMIVEEDKAGVSRMIAHSVATTPTQVAHINEFIMSARDTYPDRIIPFAALHPDTPDMENVLKGHRRGGIQGD